MENLGEKTKRSFDLAVDIVRQLITLATVIIAAVVTFFDKISQLSEHSEFVKFILCGYLVSILFGIFALLAILGNLSKSEVLSVYNFNIRLFSTLQIIMFLGSTGAIILFVGS